MFEIGLTDEERRVLAETVEAALSRLRAAATPSEDNVRREQLLARIRDTLRQADTTTSAP